jgi:hypothetical protein
VKSAPPRRRVQRLRAVADDVRTVDGVPVVASYQTIPHTARPFHLRAVSRTARLERHVLVELTEAEARKVIADLASFLGEHVTFASGAHSRQEGAPDGGEA